MKYNFDEIIDRSNTNCEKYDEREEVFGNKDVIPLWVADTDFRTPDFIVNAVKKRAEHEVYGYPVKPASFFESIQSWLLARHGWNVKLESIAYSPNVVISLASLVLALTDKGDKIVVQPPVYYPFFHVVDGNERLLVENPLKQVDGRYRFDLEDLRSKIDEKTKMLILCNPHNPGGRVWTKKELTELGNICLEKNIIVVSDEIHADLIFKGNKHVPFASISQQFSNNCISTMSASKTFNIAGLSSSFIVAENKDLMRSFKKFMNATHISSGNFFGLVATEAAFTYGHEWLDQLMAYLEENLNVLTDFIERNLPKLKVMKPEGTYLVWVDFSGLSVTAKKAFVLMNKEGVGLSPGYVFGTNGDNFMRINIGCPKSVLLQGLEKVYSALKDL